MADLDTLVATATIADTETSLAALTDALIASLRNRTGPARPLRPQLSFSIEPRQALTPRDAFFAPTELAPADRAVGRISAELVAVYPPGIPVLAPGEIITDQLIAALHDQQATGSRVAYAADPTLTTFRVVS